MVVAKRDPRVAIATDYLAKKRVGRRPQHKFTLQIHPYEIQPFCLAPVLPGETFQSCMLQSQTWTDPLATAMKNIGWWLHYNFFYVRHRDLPEAVRTTLAAMMLDPATDVSALQAGAADAKTYTFDGAIKWTDYCLQHVVSEYFRDEGEADDVAVGPSGLPMAQIYGQGAADPFERLTVNGDYEDRRVDLIQGGHLYADDLSTMMGHYNALREAGLTDMDYQDFMRTYGSVVREDEESPNLHRAEDLWSFREFTYPTNTVEPTTGVPAVAAGWRIAKQGGKRVFCDEPGFIFGVTYCRPKIYLGKQTGSVAGVMASVQQWLPAVLNNQADLGHVNLDYDAGPIPASFASGDVGYWIDVRDLLLYGDQFVNFDASADPSFLALPDATGNRRYAAAAAIENMFKTTDGTARVRMDGLAGLHILGRQTQSQPGLVLGKS